MPDTFWADISRWQQPVDDSYPWPVLAFRLDSGSGLDGNAATNWAWCRDTDTLRLAIGYVVFIPGQTTATLQRVAGFFGGTAPAKLAVMVDMESGAGFAGPGDHSVEANRFLAGLATWFGDQRRICGYGNRYDWASAWPAAPAWLKRFTAAYGTTDPGTYGWQYYGATSDPSPAGYPRGVAPFGGNVDLNVAHVGIDQMLTDFGIGDDMTPAESQMLAQILTLTQSINSITLRTNAAVDDGTTTPYHYRGELTAGVRAVNQKLDGLAPVVASMQAAIQSGGVDPAALAAEITTALGPNIANAVGQALVKGSGK